MLLLWAFEDILITERKYRKGTKMIRWLKQKLNDYFRCYVEIKKYKEQLLELEEYKRAIDLLVSLFGLCVTSKEPIKIVEIANSIMDGVTESYHGMMTKQSCEYNKRFEEILKQHEEELTIRQNSIYNLESNLYSVTVKLDEYKEEMHKNRRILSYMLKIIARKFQICRPGTYLELLNAVVALAEMTDPNRFASSYKKQCAKRMFDKKATNMNSSSLRSLND